MKYLLACFVLLSVVSFALTYWVIGVAEQAHQTQIQTLGEQRISEPVTALKKRLTFLAVEQDNATSKHLDTLSFTEISPAETNVWVQLFISPDLNIKRDASLSPPISFGDTRMLRLVTERNKSVSEPFQYNDHWYLRRVHQVDSGVVSLATWDIDSITSVLMPYRLSGRVSLISSVSGVGNRLIWAAGIGDSEKTYKRSIPGFPFIVAYNADSTQLPAAKIPLAESFIAAAVFLIVLLGLSFLYSRIYKVNEGRATKAENRAEVDSFPHHIFREYDVRAIADKYLTEKVVTDLGKAIGSEVISRGFCDVIVGRDGRLSGERIHDTLIQGIVSTGCNVTDIGMVPTAMVYFSALRSSHKNGVMITASHNPHNYNGVKFLLDGNRLSSENIQGLKRRIIESDINVADKPGMIENLNHQTDYLDALQAVIHPFQHPFKVVLDAANGVAGPVAIKALERLGVEVVPLYCDIDGRFPNHSPDPSNPKNLVDLQAAVIESKADMGIALDGDGDRVFCVDECGNIVTPDHLLMLLAKPICVQNPGSVIVHDVKSSSAIAEYVGRYGGSIHESRSGHSYIHKAMKEKHSLLGAEFSGHIFIRDRWNGCDDALVAVLRVIEVLDERAQSLSKAVSYLPQYCATSELRIPYNAKRRHTLIETLKKQDQWVGCSAINTMDGVKVYFGTSWGLIRVSNTEAVLTLRFEAPTEADLNNIKEKFSIRLKQEDPDFNWDLSIGL